MIIRGWLDSEGRPRVETEVSVPSMGYVGRVEFPVGAGTPETSHMWKTSNFAAHTMTISGG